jgi:hypothetical protein
MRIRGIITIVSSISWPCCRFLSFRLFIMNHISVAPKAKPTRGPIRTPAIQILLFVTGSEVHVAVGRGVALALAICTIPPCKVMIKGVEEITTEEAVSTGVVNRKILRRCLETYYSAAQ